MKCTDKFKYVSNSGGYELENCYFRSARYDNGNNCLLIVHSEDGPQAHCTTNNKDLLLPTNLLYVKDYSEGQGMVLFLMKMGIIEHFKNIPDEYVGLDIYPLTKSGMELFEDIPLPKGKVFCKKGCVHEGNLTEEEACECVKKCNCDTCSEDIRRMCHDEYYIVR